MASKKAELSPATKPEGQQQEYPEVPQRNFLCETSGYLGETPCNNPDILQHNYYNRTPVCEFCNMIFGL